MENWAAGGAAYAIISAIVSLINGWWDRRGQLEKIEVKDKDATSAALEVTSSALQMALNSVTVLQGQVTELNIQRIGQDNMVDAVRDEFITHKSECKAAINLMSEEVLKLNRELAASNKRVKALEEETALTKKQLQDALNEIAALQKEGEQKNQKIERLQERISDLESKLEQSEAARIAAEKERDELTRRIEQLNGKEDKPKIQSTIKAAPITGAPGTKPD